MATRERPVDRGRERARRIRIAVGTEIRTARLGYDTSQAVIAAACGLSQGYVSLAERGLAAGISIDDLTCLCEVVGLQLSIRAFPSGHPIRDTAHVSLLGELRARLSPAARWRTEVPLPIPGDQRAWDAVIVIGRVAVGIEAERRIHDAQALERRVALKKRDGALERVILLIRSSRSNRTVLRSLGPDTMATFPIPSNAALAALAAGRAPDGDSIVLL